MLNVTTTLLEIVGTLALVAGLALAAGTLAPAPWAWPAGLGTLGVGLIGASFLFTRTVRR